MQTHENSFFFHLPIFFLLVVWKFLQIHLFTPINTSNFFKFYYKNVIPLFRNNFLGCALDAEIPAEELINSFVITVKPKDSISSKNDLEAYNFEIKSCPMRRGPKPKLVIRYMELFAGIFLLEILRIIKWTMEFYSCIFKIIVYYFYTFYG